MQLIVHRVNTTERLKSTPTNYGVEVDIRGNNGRMLLSHDPIVLDGKYDELENYLTEFRHSFIIFNIKEAGYEDRVISLAHKFGIDNYFLLDVEFPYVYQATRNKGIRKIAVRYSEAEPLELAEAQHVDGVPLIDWIWIDTNMILPLDEQIVARLKKYKTCLVCPERWGRPEDISRYKNIMKELNFTPDAVMTAENYLSEWEK